MAPALASEALRDYGAVPRRQKANGHPPAFRSSTNDGEGGRPRCGVYLRVSTEKQADGGDSLYVQRLRCVELLDARFGPGGYELAVFEDPGLSVSLGPLPNESVPEAPYRPGLHALLQGVREGRITHAVALSSDRLYRDVVGIPLLRRLLPKHGAELLLVLDPVEDTIAGEMQSLVMSGFNDANRKQTRQRSQAVLDQRRDEGYWATRPMASATSKSTPRPTAAATCAQSTRSSIQSAASSRWPWRVTRAPRSPRGSSQKVARSRPARGVHGTRSRCAMCSGALRTWVWFLTLRDASSRTALG